MEISLQVVERIAKSLEPAFRFNGSVKQTYMNLIRYFHADPAFDGRLEKGLLLIGPAGTGKTFAMKVMQIYRTIDDTRYFHNGVACRMNYDIYHVNEIVRSFMTGGFDGVELYCKRYVACLDDIGSETEQVKHFGNSLDVIGHVLHERYARGLMTFGTSNFPPEIMEKKYDDRTMSRMYALFNFVVVNDVDYRRQ